MEDKGSGTPASKLADPSTSHGDSTSTQTVSNTREVLPGDNAVNSDEEREVKPAADKEPDPTYIRMLSR